MCIVYTLKIVGMVCPSVRPVGRPYVRLYLRTENISSCLNDISVNNQKVCVTFSLFAEIVLNFAFVTSAHIS